MKYILIYFNFIKYCQQPDGSFLNYVNSEQEFTPQNKLTDLADANGRAIWALGYLISLQALFPQALIAAANTMLENTLHQVADMHATRAMAFTIKGLYYRNISNNNASDKAHIKLLADRLIQMYRHEKDHEWHWFESYLTYANSLLPEALLCAWLATNKSVYKDTAKAAFDFLLSKTFSGNRIKLIANKNWLHKNDVPYKPHSGGEQPIDVAYTIIALAKFYGVFQSAGYLLKMETAFNWFLGNNHLHQVIYNPCTGGCFDGLEEHNVNLNQGAESTLSYLMAKLAVEKTKHHTALQKNSPVLFQK